MGILKPNVERLAERGDIPGLVDALGTTYDDARLAAIDALVEIGAPAVVPLVDCLTDTLGPWPGLPQPRTSKDLRTPLSRHDTRMAMLVLSVPETLWRIGEPAVGPLVAAVKDRDLMPRARGMAASTLGLTKDSRAVGPLLFYATHKCPRDLRKSALVALESYPEHRVVEGLIGVLDEGGRVADWALFALTRIGEAARPALMEAARDRTHDLRRTYAARALAELGETAEAD